MAYCVNVVFMRSKVLLHSIRYTTGVFKHGRWMSQAPGDHNLFQGTIPCSHLDGLRKTKHNLGEKTVGVIKVTVYKLSERGSIPGRYREPIFATVLRTVYRNHPAPSSIPSGCRKPKCETHHSRPSSTQIKNACDFIPTPGKVFHLVSRNNFIFLYPYQA